MTHEGPDRRPLPPCAVRLTQSQSPARGLGPSEARRETLGISPKHCWPLTSLTGTVHGACRAFLQLTVHLKLFRALFRSIQVFFPWGCGVGLVGGVAWAGRVRDVLWEGGDSTLGQSVPFWPEQRGSRFRSRGGTWQRAAVSREMRTHTRTPWWQAQDTVLRRQAP